MSKYNIAIEEMNDVLLELNCKLIALDIRHHNEEDAKKREQLDRAIYCINWIIDFVRKRIEDENFRKTCEVLGVDNFDIY